MARVFTAKDFELTTVLGEVLDAIRQARGLD